MLLVILQFCQMWVNIEICVAYWQFDQKYLCLYVSQYFHNSFHANIFGLHVPILDTAICFEKLNFSKCQTKVAITYKSLHSRFEYFQFCRFQTIHEK